jgi:hypothetical protein
MSVREAPVQNRICDIQDKDRAYKKHLDAVANAKTVIDTSAPDSRPPRPKFAVRNRTAAKPRRPAPAPAPPPRAPGAPPGDVIETNVRIGFEANPIVEEVTANRQPAPASEESALKRSIRFEDDFITDYSEAQEEETGGDATEREEGAPPRADPESFDEIPDLELPDF